MSHIDRLSSEDDIHYPAESPRAVFHAYLRENLGWAVRLFPDLLLNPGEGKSEEEMREWNKRRTTAFTSLLSHDLVGLSPGMYIISLMKNMVAEELECESASKSRRYHSKISLG